MKKFLLTLFLLTTLPLSAFANEPASGMLGKIEQSIWGFEYSQDTDEARLNRIEKSVLGEERSKYSTQERINLITQTLGIDTQEAAEAVTRQVQDLQSEGISYPMVDRIELKVLNRSFDSENIYARLDRIEEKLYGTKQSGDLDSRIEKIASSVNIEISSTPFENPDLFMQLSALETVLFKKTYSQDALGARLDRLEKRVFKRDFSGDDEGLRVQRLQAASTAQKTSKMYDANKAAKFATTSVQVGTFLLMLLAFIL
jgi:vacuolar-type H+-ATPase subunit I/STV1